MELSPQSKQLLKTIEAEMERFRAHEDVSLFYEPIRYFLSLKGKRIRPLLTILSANVIDAENRAAVYPAAAVELLHNFTLVHDDIMDNDAARRGQPTVHQKWDVSTAILTGDGLMGLAFNKLLQSPDGDMAAMARRFTETMIIICEGQALDKMFEEKRDVSQEAYLDMIHRKTAVLIELACELGGLATNGDPAQVQTLRRFGHNLGMGFQIQDDLLDIMADEDRLGKKVGSDLDRHKQTILTVLLREQNIKLPQESTPEAFRRKLESSGVLEHVQNLYRNYFDRAVRQLQTLPQNEATDELLHIAESIRDRQW